MQWKFECLIRSISGLVEILSASQDGLSSVKLHHNTGSLLLYIQVYSK